MKLKQLESLLSDVNPDFVKPKVDLEQVSTSPHIAARMVFTAANSYDDIENQAVGDFGVGPGVLSLGAHALGAAAVVGFDCDSDALGLAAANFTAFDARGAIDLVHVDVQTLRLGGNGGFDTVLMNPPFGTRNAGIDTAFVTQGMAHANAVYSLHKTSTRDHFVRLAEAKGWHLEVRPPFALLPSFFFLSFKCIFLLVGAVSVVLFSGAGGAAVRAAQGAQVPQAEEQGHRGRPLPLHARVLSRGLYREGPQTPAIEPM
jgi:hypothetical protein